MIHKLTEMLLSCFGNIKESYIEEAMNMQYSHKERRELRRKRVGVGASGLVLVTSIALVSYLTSKRRQVA